MITAGAASLSPETATQPATVAINMGGFEIKSDQWLLSWEEKRSDRFFNQRASSIWVSLIDFQLCRAMMIYKTSSLQRPSLLCLQVITRSFIG
ncbi:hypothetical protein L6452_08665 [Arctium lappa]|uniref:Uncharacterized protein n=1 Tax=Arctium lappa TaxID=4217 RepID=A0ACB9DID6_ARCLA|nr:hypothetical protein L6452_08665 [Arctium lappa]